MMRLLTYDLCTYSTCYSDTGSEAEAEARPHVLAARNRAPGNCCTGLHTPVDGGCQCPSLAYLACLPCYPVDIHNVVTADGRVGDGQITGTVELSVNFPHLSVYISYN